MIKKLIALVVLGFTAISSYGLDDASAPTKIQIPFANSAGGAYVRTVPVASQIGIQNGAASYTDGFPPLNFTPINAGGVPPFGQDMNGVIRDISAHARWWAAGGPVYYDGTYQTAIGGYPLGAVVQSATTTGKLWYSTTENNVTNPDTGGAGWSNTFTMGISGNAATATNATNATTANRVDSGMVTVASATTPDIFAAAGNTINYTGTATATGFVAAPKAGMTRTLICSGACLFTAGANLLIEGINSGNTITLGANAIVNVVAITTTQFKMTYSYSGSFTITGTGFTVNPTGTATFVVSNGTVSLLVPPLTGISNTTTFTLTGLPNSIVSVNGVYAGMASGVDASASVNIFYGVSASPNTIGLYKNVTGGTWTASSTKGIYQSSLIYLVN
jgi:hypothetical protein